MSCCNYGVCVRGGQVDGAEGDYYGKITDMILLDYRGGNTVTLFKCDWFDNSPRGTKVDKYGGIEVNQARRYTVEYDPFILAQQAEQVYYTSYPTARAGWKAVIKTKARNVIPVSKEETSNELPEPFQVDAEQVLHVEITIDDMPNNLFVVDADLEMIAVNVENDDTEDEELEAYSSSEPELDDYETPDEGMEQEAEENDSSD